VLGVCRGAQVINVAQGGTLYQDLGTQAPHALNHRNWAIYEANCHATSFVPGSVSPALSKSDARQTNSIHHQAVKIGRDLVVEACRSRIAWSRRSATRAHLPVAVQWQPGVPRARRSSFVDDTPILDEFLAAARSTRRPRTRYEPGVR